MLNTLWKLSPFSLLIAAYLLQQYVVNTPIIAQIPSTLPYILGLLLGFAALSFNRSKTALAATNICLLYAVIQQGLQQPYAQFQSQVLFLLASTVYSLNLVLAVLYREKGCFSVLGLARIGNVALSYAVMWIVVQQFDSHLLVTLVPEIFHSLIESKPWVTQGLVYIQAICGATIFLTCLIKRNTTDFSILIAWLAGILLFYDFETPYISLLISCTLILSLFIVFIQNVYALAFIDALTLLPGRRALNERLNNTGKKYALAMLDVDHFKKFNDTYGHDVGDQVLKLVAGKIGKVQMGGTAYRYGGEEFTILFPGKRAHDVLQALDTVRQSIADYEMILRDKNRANSDKKGSKKRGSLAAKSDTVHITISIGVSEYLTTDQNSDECIKRADKALYQAKENGRNQVVSGTETA